MCQVSRVRCHNIFFSGQRGGASRWTLCYQQGLPPSSLVTDNVYQGKAFPLTSKCLSTHLKKNNSLKNIGYSTKYNWRRLYLLGGNHEAVLELPSTLPCLAIHLVIQILYFTSLKIGLISM